MTQEQVINGLECCATNRLRREDCEAMNCAYLDLEGHGCIHQLIRDALALLKPRLLTEADFIDNPNVDSEGNLPAWIEFRRDEDWAEYWDDTKDEWAVVRKTNFKATGYRCWNAKPSKEQMETTDWEQEEDT